jgi:hypothetical protein
MDQAVRQVLALLAVFGVGLVLGSIVVIYLLLALRFAVREGWRGRVVRPREMGRDAVYVPPGQLLRPSTAPMSPRTGATVGAGR